MHGSLLIICDGLVSAAAIQHAYSAFRSGRADYLHPWEPFAEPLHLSGHRLDIGASLLDLSDIVLCEHHDTKYELFILYKILFGNYTAS